MTKHIKYIQKFHKWYDEDLWGYYALAEKNSKALDYLYTSFQHNPKKRRLLKKGRYLLKTKRFRSLYKQRFLYEVYTGEIEFKKKKRYFTSKNYFNKLKFRAFYGKVKVRTFRGFLNVSSKTQNVSAPSTPFFFENRLDILLYRTNLFSSFFALKQFIAHNNVMLNGRFLTNKNTVLTRGDIITIEPKIYQKVYTKFLEKLRKDRILTNFPKYLEVNYKIGSFTLIHLPKVDELAYPFGIKVRSVLHKFIR